MTDFSAFGLGPAPKFNTSLTNLGWRPFFANQLNEDERTATHPARVLSVHRSTLDLSWGDRTGPMPPLPPDHPDAPLTVGDWVLTDADGIVRRLDRASLIKRRAAGETRSEQLIAANIDTLFIVTSCNEEFSLARLERYLALAHESGVTPVVVLTKSDTSDDPDAWTDRVRQGTPGVLVHTLDARSPDAAAALAPWCGPGQTAAFVGSSGVGKSTLTNTLSGSSVSTQDIRDDDAKGRHTTTARALHPLHGGGMLLDTPGMRELGLSDMADGIAAVFGDIEQLSLHCRFSDCAHSGEPGCAVAVAIARGQLDSDRLERWRKLIEEDARNTRSVAERRKKERRFGRTVKEAVRIKGRDRGG